MTRTTEPAIMIGSIVAYAARFLQSIGVHAGPLPQARGRVTDMTLMDSGRTALCHIEWIVGDSEELPPRVNIRNLVLVGKGGIIE
jgi:hypothetical protein